LPTCLAPWSSKRYLGYEKWFAHEVKAGLDEMRSGDVAAPEEVKTRFEEWGAFIPWKMLRQ